MICISVDLNESSLSALNLHEILPVEDYVYSGYDFWCAKLNLDNQKLADLSILLVYYKDVAEGQIRVKKTIIIIIINNFNLITCVSRVKKNFDFANVRSNFILTTGLGHSILFSACWSLKSLLLRLTLHRPHIDPTLTLHRPHIDLTSTPDRPYIGLTSSLHRPHIISHRPPPPHHFYCFPPPPPLPPPHFHFFSSSTTFLLFPSTTTTTTRFLLFSPHNQHISIVFPPPPHFYCFPSTTTTTTFILFAPHNHHISIVFPPPPPPPLHFYCFPSNTTTTTTFPLFSSTTTTFLRNRENIPVVDSQTHSPNCPMVQKLPRECPNRK